MDMQTNEEPIHRGSENGNRYSPTGREVLTGITRQLIDVTAPRPDQIDIRDIALSLSQQQRFTGHCPLRPTVAEHSTAALQIARLLSRMAGPLATVGCSPRSALRAVLMHDAAEYLVSDLSGAIKKEIRGGLAESRFDVLETAAEAAVAVRYGCPAGCWAALVHECDILACAYEMSYDGWCPEAQPPDWLRNSAVVHACYRLPDGGRQAFLAAAAGLGIV